MPRMNLAWNLWLYGIFAGFIGGGATALTSGPAALLLAPKEINFTDGSAKLFAFVCITFFFGGILSTCMYLKQHPMPDIEPVVKTETTTQGRANDPNPMITVKVTELAPLDTPKT